MKATITKLSIFSLLLLVLMSCKKDAEMPNGEFVNLKTSEATEITAVSAVVSAKAGANCTERGVCWGKKPNPTIDDSHVANGSGKGDYTCTLTDLEPGQKYYYRAYAQDGERYVYASDGNNFTTLIPPLTFTANGMTFAMIYVEGGTFWMGTQGTNPSGQNYDSEVAYDNDDEQPVHQVTLSSYYIGETEVTQALWQAVMGNNPSFSTGNSQRPVESVSWNDCQEFITKLNTQLPSQLNDRIFALPTEAQWEYAARGGKKSRGYKYSGSDTLGNVAWYDDNSDYKTHAVGTKMPNELGLYDMSGNVREWCSDWYGDYDSSAQTNPTGPSSGSCRVYRGGSYLNSAWHWRVSNRNCDYPDYTYYDLGLRLVLQ